MADRNALGLIGLMFGAATAVVMMIGAVVIGNHLTGRLHIDDVSLATLPSVVAH
jgi:hypothetical protein